jgi:hypothetical protein
VAEPESLARDLAAFVTAMRKADVDGGPSAYRGGSLATVDAETRAAIEAVRHTDEPVDTEAATAAWERSLAARPWAGARCWVHSDLMPGNLLVSGDRLTGVLDFATAGVGDPAPCPWRSSSCRTTGTPIRSSPPTPATSSARSSPPERDGREHADQPLSRGEQQSDANDRDDGDEIRHRDGDDRGLLAVP